ncbi:hypothetical protein QBC45DRAFT_428067 [Copromyces sp. CBS 386.78]|nr:hypothetical protein QBC45DRAFT_428067 [Copromyces sp. CBS 386.78]
MGVLVMVWKLAVATAVNGGGDVGIGGQSICSVLFKLLFCSGGVRGILQKRRKSSKLTKADTNLNRDPDIGFIDYLAMNQLAFEWTERIGDESPNERESLLPHSRPFVRNQAGDASDGY